ncbi:class I SAM-dependent methyltransferase [Arvimicrobium flavum]|uniref:class I SAM-dependent methyltransferase n=1 Tax=Arvimicrobium flavum TaxID=3393320 RepID=UPI00237C3EE3|nr:class I SAM-dependent methyltransferase [Mesorhizobium shangrilense]
MSRLDSFIRRVTAQRDCLNHVVSLIGDLSGPVVELGLGNGRTYDHLREKLPDRRIVAFDRKFAAHLSCVPGPENLILGEISETARSFIGLDASLVHADIGTGYADRDAETLAWLPDLVAALLRSGGMSASGLELHHPQLAPVDLPASVPVQRYFLYRRM